MKFRLQEDNEKGGFGQDKYVMNISISAFQN
jgi:hypothetical protein